MIRLIKRWWVCIAYCVIAISVTIAVLPETRWNMNWIETIFLNIVGGMLTVGLIAYGTYLKTKYSCFLFRNIFGSDLFSTDGLYLVYAELVLPSVYIHNGTSFVLDSYPYRKPGVEGVGFSIERPVSSCELRGAKYLSESISGETAKAPLLASDNEVRGYLDISFISFGGGASNYKSEDILTNDGNVFFVFGDGTILSRRTNSPAIEIEGGFDYGLIMKIHPIQFPRRVWILCAGLGEWGSSGASWYLAHRWRDIQEFAGDRPFAIIVRVRRDQDEYAEPILRIRDTGDATE